MKLYNQIDSDNGLICPYCGNLHDAEKYCEEIYIKEDETGEFTCTSCEKLFKFSIAISYSWAASPPPNDREVFYRGYTIKKDFNDNWVAELDGQSFKSWYLYDVQLLMDEYLQNLPKRSRYGIS